MRKESTLTYMSTSESFLSLSERKWSTQRASLRTASLSAPLGNPCEEKVWNIPIDEPNVPVIKCALPATNRCYSIVTTNMSTTNLATPCIPILKTAIGNFDPPYQQYESIRHSSPLDLELREPMRWSKKTDIE